MYTKIKKIRRFTIKDEVDIFIGKSKFKLGRLPVYYYGEGVFVAYTPYQYKLEGDRRVEYGEKGTYAVSVYHFADIEMIREKFTLFSFDADDIKRNPNMVIDKSITYAHTFQDIHDMKICGEITRMEGETRRLVDGKVKLVYLFMEYERHSLYFLGESKKNLISGFKYALSE